MKTVAEREQVDNAEAAAGIAHVNCAFCRGTGKDPFDLLSSLSRCPACKGRGAIAMKPPTAPCAYCRGTGRQRHARLTCSACGGAGATPMPGPTAACPQCGGSGCETEADLPCSRCRGTGLVARRDAQDKELIASAEGHKTS
jgi:DnaJ-class molecular chaperone